MYFAIKLILLSLCVFGFIIIRLKIKDIQYTKELLKQNLDENIVINKLNIDEKKKKSELKENIEIAKTVFASTKKRDFMDKIDDYIDEQKANSDDYNNNKDNYSMLNSLSNNLEETLANENNSSLIDKFEQMKKIKKDIKDMDFLDSVNFEQDSNFHEAVEIDEMFENNTNVNADLFKKWAREIFETLQIGSNENKNLIKDFVTEEIFDNSSIQEQQLANDNLEYIKEDFTINELKLLDYCKSMNKEEIKILVSTSMREYIINKSTKKILKGNKRLKNKSFLMTFLKRSDIAEAFETNCPNCGSAIGQTDFSHCKYCGTLVMPIRYNWTLIKLETI